MHQPSPITHYAEKKQRTNNHKETPVTIQYVSNCSIWTLPHLFQIKLLDTSFIYQKNNIIQVMMIVSTPTILFVLMK